MQKFTSIFFKKLTYSAVCLAIALVLPFFTGQIQQFGNMLCPMHFPVILCGFICGWPWGLIVGFIAPLFRFILFGMPPLFPIGIAMAFELATYGFLSGLLYKLFPKKNTYIYIDLIISMIGGRIIWGIVRYLFTFTGDFDFPFSSFISGAVTTAIPGIILQIILIPVIVLSLKKEKIISD